MRQLGARFLRLVVVLFALSVVSFLSIRAIPGDPATTIALGSSDLQAKIKEVRKDLGLDQPLVVQYGRWANHLLHGDLGKYYRAAGPSPADEVRGALPISLMLVLYTQIVALALAVPLGAVTAYRADRAFDRVVNVGAFLALSIPSFIVGFLVKKYLALDNRVFPDSGWVPITQDIWQHFRHVVLPVLTLVLAQIAVYFRLLRSDMIATLQEDFITMAKSKGIRPRRVLFRHALRPSSLTLLTVAGLNIGTLISSTVVVENIFQIKGMGFLLAQGILSGEYVATQSFIVIVGVVFVLVNFLVDFLYTVLDPRIRRA